MRQKGLQELCLGLLARNIDACPTLQFIPSELCDRLFELVLQLHPPSTQTLRLLATLAPGNVTTLDLTGVKALNETALLTMLTQTSLLRHLSLRDEPRGPFVTARVLATVATLTDLRELSLVKCNNLTDASLRILGGSLGKLVSLRLEGMKKVTSAGLDGLSGLAGLSELSLAQCPLVSSLGKIPKMIVLQLRVLDVSFTGLLGSSLKNLTTLLSSSGKLDRLLLRGLSLSPKAFAGEVVLRGQLLTRMSSFAVAGNVNIGRLPDLSLIMALSGLVALDLNKTQINVEGVGLLTTSHLSSTLKVFGLAKTRVAQEIGSLLREFRGLRFADISFNYFQSLSLLLEDLRHHPGTLEMVDASFCDWEAEFTREDLTRFPSILKVVVEELLADEESKGRKGANSELLTIRQGFWDSHFGFYHPGGKHGNKQERKARSCAIISSFLYFFKGKVRGEQVGFVMNVCDQPLEGINQSWARAIKHLIAIHQGDLPH